MDAVLFPSWLKAEMIPVPFPTAVINPEFDTVTTRAIAEDHNTVLFVAFKGAIVAID
jgi:hypothetical protein